MQWVCPACTFRNSHLLESCEICQRANSQEGGAQQQQQEEEEEEEVGAPSGAHAAK